MANYTLVVCFRGAERKSIALSGRRLPDSTEVLLDAVHNAGETDVADSIQKLLEDGDCVLMGSDSYTPGDEYDSDLEIDLDGGDEFDDGATLYLFETFDPADDAADEEVEEADITNLITVVVKVHGGDKKVVNASAGVSVQRVLNSSGLAYPSGASFAFNGDDVTLESVLTHGGQLTIAGRVTGGC